MATTSPSLSSTHSRGPQPIEAPKCPIPHAFPVLITCFIMAANAGFINTFFLESVFETSVTHLTGTTSQAAIAYTKGSYDLMAWNFGIILSFFFGSALNSLIVGDSPLKLVHNYGFVILLEALLIITPVFIPNTSSALTTTSIYILAFACGLQNAMLTIYGTAVVRTTHVTGLVTDMGILLGLYIRDLIVRREKRVEGMWKLKIMIPLYFGFFTGGTLGMLSTSRLPGNTPLIFPAVSTAIIGIGFTVLRYVHKKHEEKIALMSMDTSSKINLNNIEDSDTESYRTSTQSSRRSETFSQIPESQKSKALFLENMMPLQDD